MDHGSTGVIAEVVGNGARSSGLESATTGDDGAGMPPDANAPLPVRQPARRLVSDFVALVVCAALFLLFAAIAANGLAPGEVAVFRAVNQLPDFLYVVIWPFMQYGVIVTTPLLGLLALGLRRYRLSAAVFTAGVGVYLLAKVVKQVVQRGRPDALIRDVIEREPFGASFGFPSGHAAVAGALTVVGTDALRGRWRWVPAGLLGMVFVGRTYVGGHLPLDLVGGSLLGASAGYLAVLVVGRPGSGQATAAPLVAKSAPHSGARASSPFARHPGDIVRVATGILVLAATAVAVQRDTLSIFERDLFRLVNDLPEGMAPAVYAVMQLGNLVAGPIVAAGVATVARLRRMALDLSRRRAGDGRSASPTLERRGHASSARRSPS